MTTTLTCKVDAIHLASPRLDAERLDWRQFDASQGFFHSELTTCLETGLHDTIYEWGYRTVRLYGHDRPLYGVRRFTRRGSHAIIHITAPIELPPSAAFKAAAHQWLALLNGRAI